jgi:hypothetical protein
MSCHVLLRPCLHLHHAWHGVYSEAVACIRQYMYTADRNIPSSPLLALPCLLSCMLAACLNFLYMMQMRTTHSTLVARYRQIRFVGRTSAPSLKNFNTSAGCFAVLGSTSSTPTSGHPSTQSPGRSLWMSEAATGAPDTCRRIVLVFNMGLTLTMVNIQSIGALLRS